MIVFLLSAFAYSDCSRTLKNRRFDYLLQSGLQAFSKENIDLFDARREELISRISCVNFILTPRQAARFHQQEALEAYLVRDFQKMGGHIRAAMYSDPKEPFPISRFPSDHPLRTYISFVQTQEYPAAQTLSRPMTGSIFLNGKETLLWDSSMPNLFQHRMDKGIRTMPIKTGEIPPYLEWSGNRGYQVRLQPEWANAAAVSAGIAVGLGIWGHIRKMQFWNPETPTEDLESLQLEINTVSSLALVGATVSGVCLGISIYSGRW
ncbi:MAG: hypothetical protein VX278_03795 [Myxococcota bacterium]|nr:hypothetical protein [Myxococcota bacterium]